MKYKALSVLLLLFILTSCKSENTNEIKTPDPGDKKSLSVLSPNGGESIKEGSSYEIKWSGGANTLVKIQYTIDNCSTWSFIADSVLNTGKYSWFPVPNRISNQCKIKISAADAGVSDQSDAGFTIIRNDSQSLLLRAPNGAESWEAGTKKQITWFSSGIDSVKLEYTADNGSRWNLITVDKKNNGAYYWNPVPNTPSSSVKVKISDAKDGYPFAISQGIFTILPEQKLTLKVPNGGEKWFSGSNRTIEWESENIQNVKIQYSTNSGADWYNIVQSIPNSGSYLWNNIPQHNSAICLIRISDSADDFPFTVSGHFFTITNQIVKLIRIDSPNGGEVYEAGDTKEIKWSSENVQFFDVEFLLSNNPSFSLLLASRISNTGSINWNIPAVYSNQCKIRVKDSDDPSVYDESDALFVIKHAKSIHVVSPNGGETFYEGAPVLLTWEYNGVDFVNIEYSISTDGTERIWETIAAGVANTGSFSFAFSQISSGYKIRVSAAGGNPSDESDELFTVIKNQLSPGSYPPKEGAGLRK